MRLNPLILSVFCLLPSARSTAQNMDGKEIGKLVVGVVLPMSGPQAAYGVEALTGIKLAMEDIARDHPQYHQLIRILVGDDKSTASGAETAAKSLIRRRASIFLGSVTRTNSASLARVAKEFHKPLVIPANSSLPLRNPSPLIFRSCALDRWQGYLLGEFASKTLGKTNAAILLDPKDHLAHDVAEHFTRNFRRNGGKISLREMYQRGSQNTDFKGRISKIGQSGAQVILFPTSDVEEAAAVMTELRRQKINIPLLGLDRWNTPRLGRTAGPAYPGHFYILPFSSAEPGAATQNFVSRFKARTRRFPSALAAMAYDAMLLVADSFKRAGTSRAKELARAIKRTHNLKGLLGPVSINANQTAEKSGVVMMTTGRGSQAKALVHPM